MRGIITLARLCLQFTVINDCLNFSIAGWLLCPRFLLACESALANVFQCYSGNFVHRQRVNPQSVDSSLQTAPSIHYKLPETVHETKEASPLDARTEISQPVLRFAVHQIPVLHNKQSPTTTTILNIRIDSNSNDYLTR